MDAAAGTPLPDPAAPMLATLGDLPIGPEWACKFKWDGVRAVAQPGRGRAAWRASSPNASARRTSPAAGRYRVREKRRPRRGTVLLPRLEPWPETAAEAIDVQNRLRKMVRLDADFSRSASYRR